MQIHLPTLSVDLTDHENRIRELLSDAHNPDEGQRAKRFISIGAILESSLLEEVPLVKRGELVTITSAIGGVSVVTTAKAAGSGLLGEVVRIRSLSSKHVEFDAVVVGPGHVEITEGRLPITADRLAVRAGS